MFSIIGGSLIISWHDHSVTHSYYTKTLSHSFSPPPLLALWRIAPPQKKTVRRMDILTTLNPKSILMCGDMIKIVEARTWGPGESPMAPTRLKTSRYIRLQWLGNNGSSASFDLITRQDGHRKFISLSMNWSISAIYPSFFSPHHSSHHCSDHSSNDSFDHSSHDSCHYYHHSSWLRLELW